MSYLGGNEGYSVPTDEEVARIEGEWPELLKEDENDRYSTGRTEAPGSIPDQADRYSPEELVAIRERVDAATGPMKAVTPPTN
jgi:hypothetical protein